VSVHQSDRHLGMAGVVAVSFIVLRACPVAAAIVYGLRGPLRIGLDLSDRVKAPEALGFRRGVDVVAQADETRRQSGRERGRLLLISMDLLSGHATVRRARPSGCDHRGLSICHLQAACGWLRISTRSPTYDPRAQC